MIEDAILCKIIKAGFSEEVTFAQGPTSRVETNSFWQKWPK